MTAISVQTDTTVFRFGTQSLKITTGDSGSNAFYAEDADVEPNIAYTFSCYVKTNVALTGGGVMLRIAQGGTLTPSLADSAIITDSTTYEESVDGWYRIILTFTVPDGVFTVRPIIRYTGTTAGQTVWLDGVKFEVGDLASAWQLNTVSKKLVIDQGAVQVDAFEGGILRLRGSTGGTRDTVSLGPHGLLFGGDVNIAAQTAGVIDIDGDLTVTGGDLTLNTDVRLSRSAAKTLKFGDSALAALTAIDFLGALMRGFSGTSFPASPTTNDRFYRTDYGLWFFYDGTRWLSVELFLGIFNQVVLSATSTTQYAQIVDGVGTDKYIETAEVIAFVNGGTALSASHKWVATGASLPSATTASWGTIVDLSSGASSVFREFTKAVNGLFGADSLYRITWTKTGTPGDLTVNALVRYRVVST